MRRNGRHAIVDGWLAGPRTGPSPPAYRHYLIRQYAERYERDTLIESGSCEGDTVAAVVDLFAAVWTIELAPALYERVVHRFRNAPNVHCIPGDSTVMLPKVLTSVSKPALLWIDAHWSEGSTAHGDKETPVVAELEAILSDTHHHVVLIDDYRCSTGEEHDCGKTHEDYPSPEWVRDRATTAGYIYEVSDDVVRLVHRDEWVS